MSARRRPRAKRELRLTDLLRPRPGRRFPAGLRARHVGRLAVGLDFGGSEFEDLLRRIDGGATFHPGTSVELLTDGPSAAEAMLAAIDGAATEVLVESYIFTDDEVGRRFAESLGRSAGRGVTVRVLADGFGSFATSEDFWRDLREAGVEVRLFHRLARSLWWQPFRDHRKILVVDRRVGFTGGMNIAREYASFRPDFPHRKGMRDTHLRLEGSVARELAAVFSEGWERAGGDSLVGPGTPEGNEAEGTGDPRVSILESRPGRGYAETAASLAAIVSAAKESVWIANAYFAPGHLALAILGRAVSRGVDVRLLLPGLSDAPLVRHAGHGYYRRLLKRGVRIFEYQPAILHSKTVVADRFVSVVGSTNLDFRSFSFNAECNAVILDAGIGEHLARQYEADLEQSEEIDRSTWRRRPIWHRIGDRLAAMLAPIL